MNAHIIWSMRGSENCDRGGKTLSMNSLLAPTEVSHAMPKTERRLPPPDTKANGTGDALANGTTYANFSFKNASERSRANAAEVAS